MHSQDQRRAVMSGPTSNVVITTAARHEKRRFALKPATLRLRKLMKRLEKVEQELRQLKKQKALYERQQCELETKYVNHVADNAARMETLVSALLRR